MKFTFLIENMTYESGTVGEHGLSIYIEAHDKKILFDAGASDAFAGNAETLGVDLKAVELAVISHGHYDHTGGFPKFCEINQHAPIYLQKNAFRQSRGFEDGIMDDYTCGILWTEEQKQSMADRLVFTDAPVFVDDNIAISGGINIAEGFQPTEKFVFQDENGQFIDDDMSHEQILVIREDDGLYVFSGCSHTGVLNAIDTAKAIFPGEKVALLVAGMHLYSADEECRNSVIDEVVGAGVDKMIPMHCTGINAICDLKKRLGDRCILGGTGVTYESNR